MCGSKIMVYYMHCTGMEWKKVQFQMWLQDYLKDQNQHFEKISSVFSSCSSRIVQF